MQKRIEADKISRKYRWKSEEKKTFPWIEKLLNKPIDSNRYYCVWRILIPYLINIRKLSRQDAYNIISDWLDRCNSLKRLNFSRRKVDWSIDHVGRYLPVRRLDLEQDNKLLFELLKSEGVVY